MLCIGKAVGVPLESCRIVAQVNERSVVDFLDIGAYQSIYGWALTGIYWSSQCSEYVTGGRVWRVGGNAILCDCQPVRLGLLSPIH